MQPPRTFHEYATARKPLPDLLGGPSVLSALELRLVELVLLDLLDGQRCVLAGEELDALLAASHVLGGCREQHVRGGVERRLAGVLDDADDEADGDDLHGDILADAEQ